MIQQYEAYVNGLGGSDEVLTWVRGPLRATIKKSERELDQAQVEHILDYLMSEAAPRRLRRMSYKQANEAATKWSKAQQKRGAHIQERPTDVETIHNFSDGSRIVKLVDKRAFEREGYLMSHCVGSYHNSDSTIYSYRDAKNMPHATFEVTANDGEIMQIKGKGNGPIHPKYIEPILAFLKSLGISVRSSEMRNLGYYEVPDEVELMIQQHYAPEHWPQYHTLYGVRYAYSL